MIEKVKQLVTPNTSESVLSSTKNNNIIGIVLFIRSIYYLIVHKIFYNLRESYDFFSKFNTSGGINKFAKFVNIKHKKNIIDKIQLSNKYLLFSNCYLSSSLKDKDFEKLLPQDFHTYDFVSWKEVQKSLELQNLIRNSSYEEIIEKPGSTIESFKCSKSVNEIERERLVRYASNTCIELRKLKKQNTGMKNQDIIDLWLESQINKKRSPKYQIYTLRKLIKQKKDSKTTNEIINDWKPLERELEELSVLDSIKIFYKKSQICAFADMIEEYMNIFQDFSRDELELLIELEDAESMIKNYDAYCENCSKYPNIALEVNIHIENNKEREFDDQHMKLLRINMTCYVFDAIIGILTLLLMCFWRKNFYSTWGFTVVNILFFIIIPLVISADLDDELTGLFKIPKPLRVMLDFILLCVFVFIVVRFKLIIPYVHSDKLKSE